MKSQDIVILLKLASLQEQGGPGVPGNSDDVPGHEEPYSVRGLGASLGISKTEVSASLNRSLASGLAVRDPERGRPKPNRRGLCDFIVHGLKFVFPARPGAPLRGMPTAFAAPMLQGRLLSAGDDIHVWPDAKGRTRGLSVEPLFRSVPQAVGQDERLYEYLALVDAIRLGRQREANLAAEIIREGLLKR